MGIVMRGWQTPDGDVLSNGELLTEETLDKAILRLDVELSAANAILSMSDRLTPATALLCDDFAGERFDVKIVVERRK